VGVGVTLTDACDGMIGYIIRQNGGRKGFVFGFGFGFVLGRRERMKLHLYGKELNVCLCVCLCVCVCIVDYFEINVNPCVCFLFVKQTSQRKFTKKESLSFCYNLLLRILATLATTLNSRNSQLQRPSLQETLSNESSCRHPSP
jgi:hypothetical protein